MGLVDELMFEKGKIKGAESHVTAGQVTSREIVVGSIVAGDIAAGAITKEKLAAAVVGDGIAGGAGVAMTIDPDASLTKTGGTGQQLAVAAGGVLAAHIAANCKGDGFVAGAGAFVVSPDGVGTELNAGVLRLRDAGVTKARLAPESKRHIVSVPLVGFNGAGGTVRQGVLAVPLGKVYTILKAELSATIVPICAGGTTTVQLVNYDVSDAADEELVAAWNAEGLVAKIGTELALITAGGVNVLGQHDMLFIVLVSGAAVGTPWQGAVLTLEYEEA